MERLTDSFLEQIGNRRRRKTRASKRRPGCVTDAAGRTEWFDHVVIGAHADQALAMLDDPSPAERSLLGAFAYSQNVAVLHSDASLHAEAPRGVVELELHRHRRSRP